MVKKIVVVDDDEAVRDSLLQLLEIDGFSVETYDSGASFLSRCDLRGILCLVVDHNMPSMTGLTLASQLRVLGAAMPIIMITGVPDKGLQQKAVAAGVDLVLAKPFTQDQLLDCITSAVGSEASCHSSAV